MALSLVRTALGKSYQNLLQDVGKNPVFKSYGIRGVPGTFITCQVAFISCKKLRQDIQKPPPFPYQTKKYGYLRSIFDLTTKRFDENTKVIVVDGNIAAGKTSFSKKLAEELDMKYVREPVVDMKYIQNGYNMKQLDPYLPDSLKSFVLQDFLKNPLHKRVASFQLDFFVLRLEMYIDAICHLLNTGEGIIMDRCVYSDMVFLETMFKFGYVSKQARNVYYRIRKRGIEDLLRPHLVIYLDVPAETCLERIKRRATPHEVNTKVLTLDYLKTLEHVYKTRYLKEMSVNSEILVYDWSEYGDVDVVVEDIERLDFDNYDLDDLKCVDWKIEDVRHWNEIRMEFTNDKEGILENINFPDLEAEELIVSAEDMMKYDQVVVEVS
ncbi:NADH dehydrogenase [ubiquinone] 1 alpha subcomplex subunit 10, mitochondrial [Nymphon striatum]|nr:NADH dehydrogenase [ubiquinone] 1 alpha subcomplex subunit 10, mitochondrial [Nymphon striatum]